MKRAYNSVSSADKTGGLVTAEEWQWKQNNNPQADGYHPVLPRDPAGGIPWQHVRSAFPWPFGLFPGTIWCAGMC